MLKGWSRRERFGLALVVAGWTMGYLGGVMTGYGIWN